jgi:plastocyanin
MAMQGMMTGWQQGTWFAMMPFLPPANYGQGTAHEYSYTLSLGTSGTLWYMCTYPGHAQMGMYGQIVVAG